MRAARALAAGGMLAALACAAGPARPDAHYRLEAAAPPSLPAPVLDGVLEVERFRSDVLTGERSLLFRADPGSPELRRQAYALWVDPPTVMLQIAFARALRGAGLARDVVTSDQRRSADFVLAGRIHRLERLLEGARVALELELTVTRERDRAALLHATYRDERAARGSGTADAVRALSDALDAIVARVVGDLVGPPRVSGRPGRPHPAP